MAPRTPNFENNSRRFFAKDLMNIDNRVAYLKMLSNGKPVRPFNIETIAPSVGDKENITKLKDLSYLKFGRDKASIEEVMRKYEGGGVTRRKIKVLGKTEKSTGLVIV